jgi:hypothetical protein
VIRLLSAAWVVGVTGLEKFKVTLQGENSRSGLDWCLAMTLLKTLFVCVDFLQDKNLRSMIERRWRLCTYPFAEASLLKMFDF